MPTNAKARKATSEDEPRPKRRRARRGWTIREMTFEQASAEDAARHAAMSPAERVRLAFVLFTACLSTRGHHGPPPRLQRVYSYPE